MHHVVQGKTPLHEPGCKRVAEIMKSHIREPRLVTSMVKRSFDPLHGLTPVSKHGAGFFRTNAQEGFIGPLTEPDASILAILGIDER